MPTSEIQQPVLGIPEVDQPEGVSIFESLAGHHTLGLDCTAWAFATATDMAHLGRLVQWAYQNEKRTVLIGGGSNLTFGKDHLDALVVRLGQGFRELQVHGPRGVVRVGAAIPWRRLIKACRDAGFGGLEYGWCIPGTMGGALAGNAGAAGRAVCEDVVRVRVLNRDGDIAWMTSGDFQYSYRTSTLRQFVILEAELNIEVAAPDVIDAKLEEMKAMRKTQPVGVASSGCVFKNPVGKHAGRIIDECGLKGKRIGKMSVSTDHANFMVNEGGAAPSEFLALIDEVRDHVYMETGILLEPEVRIIT
jgi:UDP-N-acetylmuramate dehydrogenase